jgi:endonuclease/exonuclease/phosphatase (EEP) superfamily protein YafD
MNVLKTALTVFIVLLIASCVSIPDGVKKRTVQNDQTAYFSFVCHPGNDDHVISSRNGKPGMLDPREISLLNWNVFKGESESWMQAFRHYSEDQDLITLQEAYLTDNFRALLDQQGLNWDLATAFRKLKYAAGVMTASPTLPLSVCVQRNMEPWVLLPKATLISVYPLKNSKLRLLLINIHAINFTLGDIAFRNQLIQIAGALIEHKGPVIVAGDFNTWSQSREHMLNDVLVEPFALSEVYFNSSKLKTVFKHQLDHVYYRDLDVIKNSSVLTRVSDHNPMWVTFKYTKENLK